jgi:hypothetical protein
MCDQRMQSFYFIGYGWKIQMDLIEKVAKVTIPRYLAAFFNIRRRVGKRVYRTVFIKLKV